MTPRRQSSYRWIAAVSGAVLAAAGLRTLRPMLRPVSRVAVSLPLSGPKRDSGQAILDALRLYIEENRDAGGRRLELVVRDDADVPARAVENAKAFVADPSIIAVIGHYDDAVAQAAVPLYDKAHLPVFLPTISDTNVIRLSPWAFGGTYSDEREGETLAVYLSAVKNRRRAVVLRSSDAYGSHLAAAFALKAKRLGLRVEEAAYDEDAELPTDFCARRAATLRAADVFVLFGHSVKGAALIRQLHDLGVSTAIYGSSRVATDLLTKLGGQGDEVHVSFPFLYDLASIKTNGFVRRYRARFGTEPTVFSAFAYDGLGLLAAGLERVGPDRTALRDFLASLDSEEKAVDGVSGRLYFDKDGSMARHVLLGTARGDVFIPALDQLQRVTDRHTLSQLPEKVKAGEVALIDGTPYHKISIVYVGVDFYRINQADFRNPNYDAEYFLWFKWRGDVDVDNIAVLNEVEGSGTRTELRRNFGVKGRADPTLKWISYKVKGSYAAHYNLKLFPFDGQRLSLSFVHRNRNANKVMLVADREQESSDSLTDYPQDWRVLGREDYSGTFNFHSNFGNPAYLAKEAQADYSVYNTSLVVHRVLFPYLITLFLPLIVLLAITLSAVYIPLDDFGSRIALVMTALLGVLVEHMNEARSLPQVGYLLRADYFYVAAYALFFILVVEMNVANRLRYKERLAEAEALEKKFIPLFAALSLGVYAALAASAFLAGRRAL